MARPTISWALLATVCGALLCATFPWYMSGGESVAVSTGTAIEGEAPGRTVQGNSLRSRKAESAEPVTDWNGRHDWEHLQRAERIDIMMRIFNDSLASASSDPLMLESATSALSVLRADLILEDGDRDRYDALEKRYDALAGDP